MRPRWLTVFSALLGAAWLLCSVRARAADPYLRWYTVVTPHFRVHHHGGLERVAQRVAQVAEDTHRRLVPELGWAPREVTEVLLVDTSEDANGSASSLPFNAVRLFVSGPSDMSVLADYDDWLLELVVHEYTHTLHIDNVHGLPALINAVFGKSIVPNQSQPRWLIEGLATLMESKHTSGGRLVSSQFEMFLRADVLDDDMLRLDQLSHSPARWPGGNVWYLYGSYFLAYVAELYGADIFRAISTDYGQNAIPWGINRSLYRATGRTYPELYRAWKDHLQRRFSAQAARVRARGLREGRRLTHHGRIAFHPRFEPACGRGTERAIVYFRDDGHLPPGYYRLSLDAPRDPELVARASEGFSSFEPACGLVFESSAPSRRRYRLSDLFRQAPGTRSTSSSPSGRKRLTVGMRAREPSVSPDGKRIAFVTNRAGTTTLRIAELDHDFRLSGVRALVPSARYEQAFTPRFSPDGRHVAYGAWTAGGFRDIRIVDVQTGRYRRITHDRALDQQPTFSPDGRYLLFTSDRTGIPNVYAHELATRTLFQVTNVVTGAYMPELSPDGGTLIYAGYTSLGYDLFAMPFERERWLPAPPAIDARPPPHVVPERGRYLVEPYDPWGTLRPRAYALSYGTGTFGNALSVSTTGADIVGHHAFRAEVTVETEHAEPQAVFDYVYARLPFDLRLRATRRAAPREDYRFGDQDVAVTEHSTGVTSGLSYFIPGELEAQSLAVTYSLLEFEQELPIRDLVDPFARLPQEPPQGLLSLVHFGYSYSNAEGTAFGISAERGFSLALGVDYAGHELGSESTLAVFTARGAAYVGMPYLRHHVLALGLSGGASTGTYPRRGLFFTGGFADTPAFDVFVDGIQQGAFQLRGYEPAQFIGRHFNLLNVEYRSPLLYTERGISSLPVYLRELSLAAFFDVGGAFDVIDLDDPLASYHASMGAELWFDLTLGYYSQANLRLGIARGLDRFAPGIQTYWVASAAF